MAHRQVRPHRQLSRHHSGKRHTLYLYGEGLAFEVRPDGSHRYYHSDALGSTRVVTDDAGNPVSGYNYDAYGATRKQAEGKRTFRSVNCTAG